MLMLTHLYTPSTHLPTYPFTPSTYVYTWSPSHMTLLALVILMEKTWDSNCKNEWSLQQTCVNTGHTWHLTIKEHWTSLETRTLLGVWTIMNYYGTIGELGPSLDSFVDLSNYDHGELENHFRFFWGHLEIGDPLWILLWTFLMMTLGNWRTTLDFFWGHFLWTCELGTLFWLFCGPF